MERWVRGGVLVYTSPDGRHGRRKARRRRATENDLAARRPIARVLNQNCVVAAVRLLDMGFLRRMVRIRVQWNRARCADEDERNGETDDATKEKRTHDGAS